MINLLLPPEKKYLGREYRRRFAILALKGVFLLAAVSAIPVLPAYLRLASAERAAGRRLEALETGRASSLGREVRASVSDINQKLSIFTFKPEWSFSQEILRPILDRRGTNPPESGRASIQLNSFFAEKTAAGAAAKLRGRAADRDELLEFRRRLETVSQFARVNLPISSFVKGRDIEFNLDIALSEKNKQ